MVEEVDMMIERWYDVSRYFLYCKNELVAYGECFFIYEGPDSFLVLKESSRIQIVSEKQKYFSGFSKYQIW